jgi:hypothetical protein
MKIDCFEKGYFCPKCGKRYSAEISKDVEYPNELVCESCETTLVQEEPTFLHYTCEICNEIYEAELEWLELHNFICISCKGHLVNVCSLKKETAFHVSIDGSWDGVPVGKKIQEKNEQLKGKLAGYSYEQSTIKEKVGEMVQKRQSEGW